MQRLILIMLSIELMTLMARSCKYNVLPRCGTDGCSVWVWIDLPSEHQKFWEIGSNIVVKPDATGRGTCIRQFQRSQA